MDDGFQNPSLAKDLCIVAVDPAYGVGNGQVFPSGPLRERLADGLARADAIVMLHNTWNENTPEQPEWLDGFGKPCCRVTSPVGSRGESSSHSQASPGPKNSLTRSKPSAPMSETWCRSAITTSIQATTCACSRKWPRNAART
jgi:hypothetical protein